MIVQTIHPFPARMAPELALESLRGLQPASIVLDPMMGSGTVLRHAGELGHSSVGFDMDPLAVLMSSVWTTGVPDDLVRTTYQEVREAALAADPGAIKLPWQDEDAETLAFVNFWFGKQQARDLRCIAWAISQKEAAVVDPLILAALNVVKVSLSRIIVTKEPCASLARDTSHSRPHRVSLTSDYSVFEGLEKSVLLVRKRLSSLRNVGVKTSVKRGDARRIGLPDASVDAVLTSPPYLNAIDYMRGHRMSLVWLGYRLCDLRHIRSNSIGAERRPENNADLDDKIIEAMGDVSTLASRNKTMIARYAGDLKAMLSETARVLKPNGTATFVVGNSCLKGVFISNACGVAKAAEIAGLDEVMRFERELPDRHRYLPTPTGGSLAKRMRTETIICLSHRP
ncbi:site-specific DNA-methyltransferase [Sinorhizobium meliloti]|uniref:site-specific DNA-methyltransferase n=1 Tax=Rhizobium meliloti TaxID=382 RepID=UPI001F489521|nr:site-specific DNA-methyltransferase [Sinorhizobium meliloti]